MQLTKIIEYTVIMMDSFNAIFDIIFNKTFSELQQNLSQQINLGTLLQPIVDTFFNIVINLFGIADVTIFEFMFEVGIGIIIIFTIGKWITGLVIK